MDLSQKIGEGSVSLYNYLNRKPMADQSQGSSPLPIELLQMIFENLSIADQVRASRASKFWFNVLLGLTWSQYIREYGDAPAHFFTEGFDWHKEKLRRDAAEINFSNGRYWYETLAASPSNMHARRHYLVSSVRGMEVLVHQFRWTSNSYEEAAELMRSFTLDLATETSTSTRYEAGVWIGSSYVVPIFNTHGINWVKFGVYEQGISQSSLPEEEGDTIIKLVRQHDVEMNYGMKRNLFEYFRITDPPMVLRVVPNNKHKSKFLVYSEPFKREKRALFEHSVILDNYMHTFKSFDGILAYWGNYIVYSTERSIEFYNISTRMVDRVYGLNLDQLIFARVGISNDIMAYTAEDKIIAVWDLKQNKLLTSFNYFDKVFPGEDKPSVMYLNSIIMSVNKLLLNFGWGVVIDWRTKKVLELPFMVEDATFLADGSLIVSSKNAVHRVRFDVDMGQTVNLMKLSPSGEFVQEPIELDQLDVYLHKTYSGNSRSLTFLIDEPTGMPSYKGTQIHAVARVTGFWKADAPTPVTNPLLQALKQLKVPPMTSSVRVIERCSDLVPADWQPQEVVLFYERLIDGRWTPCNPFGIKAEK
jgi:hypothetical protein